MMTFFSLKCWKKWRGIQLNTFHRKPRMTSNHMQIIHTLHCHHGDIMVQCLNVSIRDRNLPAAFVELRLLRGRPLCSRPDLLSANEGTPVVASTPREHSQWSWQTGAEGNSVSYDDCCGVLNSQKKFTAQLETNTWLKLCKVLSSLSHLLFDIQGKQQRGECNQACTNKHMHVLQSLIRDAAYMCKCAWRALV